MPANEVNNKETIKKQSKPKYYHCFKLSETNYALFDAKMDMPIIIGSIAIVKSAKLPPNSIVFYYELNSHFFFEKGANKYIEIKGEGIHQKPPLRYHYLNPDKFSYHHFKITPVLSVIFDDEFDSPLAYGSNQRVQAIINKISKTSTIFYYKEDARVEHSFKLFMIYKGKRLKS
jgi:hypothetical protein